MKILTKKKAFIKVYVDNQITKIMLLYSNTAVAMHSHSFESANDCHICK